MCTFNRSVIWIVALHSLFSGADTKEMVLQKVIDKFAMHYGVLASSWLALVLCYWAEELRMYHEC